MVQLDTSALGRIVNEETVSNLPLVTRNFTQIAGLSPGVIVGVPNAGELGVGHRRFRRLEIPMMGVLYTEDDLTTTTGKWTALV